MKKALQSPWFSVVLAIVVMTIGYTAYLNKNGKLAAANSYFCPLQAVCEASGCNGENDCSKDECTGCPFCNKKTS